MDDEKFSELIGGLTTTLTSPQDLGTTQALILRGILQGGIDVINQRAQVKAFKK